MGSSSERYHEVGSAPSISKETGTTHKYLAPGWIRTVNRVTSMITELEAETAAINRFPLDDDYLRISSISDMELTYLQPKIFSRRGLYLLKTHSALL